MYLLTQKQYRSYDRVSRYSPFPYYFDSSYNRYVYGTTRQLKIEDTPFVSHKVELGDTYDTIALYYYNNPTYYWVITDFNRIKDPFVAPKQGTILKIPTFGAIQFDFSVR